MKAAVEGDAEVSSARILLLFLCQAVFGFGDSNSIFVPGKFIVYEGFAAVPKAPLKICRNAVRAVLAACYSMISSCYAEVLLHLQDISLPHLHQKRVFYDQHCT